MGSLLLNILALVLLVAVLVPAEHALKHLTRRHLDRSRRVMRACVFLAGVGGWALLSYIAVFGAAGEGWFISFLAVAGLWKLTVDVLIFGAPDRAGPSSQNR